MQYPVGMIVLRVGQKPILALKDFFQTISSTSILTEIKISCLFTYQLQNQERKSGVFENRSMTFQGIICDISICTVKRNAQTHFKAMFLHL